MSLEWTQWLITTVYLQSKGHPKVPLKSFAATVACRWMVLGHNYMYYFDYHYFYFIFVTMHKIFGQGSQ